MALFYSSKNNITTVADESGAEIIIITSDERDATSIAVHFKTNVNGAARLLVWDVGDVLLFTGDAIALNGDFATFRTLSQPGLTPLTTYQYQIEACDDEEFAPPP